MVTEDELQEEIEIVKRVYGNSRFSETRPSLIKRLQELELQLAKGEFNENDTVSYPIR